MKASILTIGDELLIGQVVNTNAAWLGEQLNLLGVEVAYMVTLGDDETAIREALEHACAATDLVLLTGGLGPTHDDVTRDVVAAYFKVSLQLDPSVLEKIKDRFRRRRRDMPESSRDMALVPESFEALSNTVGTAPGLWRVDTTNGERRIVVVLPGVPKEMKAIFQEEVMPRLQQQDGLRVIAHRTLRTVGIGESNLQEKVGDLSDYLGPQVRLAYLPSTTGVRLRLTARGDDRRDVEHRLGALEARLRERIDAYIYGVDDDRLEAALGRLMAERGLTIAVAESCTGGLVLHRLTNIPGSSAYVVGGVVAYSNAVKVQLLGVDAEALVQEGAVSAVVAQQMAQGVRQRLGADVGIATTGVAGPTGGTPEKPVGTVWIAFADAQDEVTRLLHLVKDREMNKELTSTAVLDLVRQRLRVGG